LNARYVIVDSDSLQSRDCHDEIYVRTTSTKQQVAERLAEIGFFEGIQSRPRVKHVRPYSTKMEQFLASSKKNEETRCQRQCNTSGMATVNNLHHISLECLEEILG
jgi:hypothetical protein